MAENGARHAEEGQRGAWRSDGGPMVVVVNAFPVQVKALSSYYDKIDHCGHGGDQAQKHSHVDQQAKC